ncbi:MAG: hypothetical protein LBR82_07165 [Desulfovibrio sp.]|jgi:hypothetical protein|nr:hypothetical protein [Desulfovibrio sp.]
MSNHADQGIYLNAERSAATAAATHNPEQSGRTAGRFEPKSGDLYE